MLASKPFCLEGAWSPSIRKTSISHTTWISSRLRERKTSGRHFTHPKSEFFVEFPSAPLAVGNEPVKIWKKLETPTGVIQILTPTQSVMDRLAGYFAWNDRQNLDQAIMVAKKQNVNLSKIRSWARQEGEMAKYETFLSALKKRKENSDDS